MRFKTIYFLMILFVFACTIFSQPKPPSKREKLKQLKEMLDLSDLQAKKIETILSSTEKKMNAVREKMEDQRDEAMDQMDSIMSDEDNAIETVLDDPQKEKYEEMKKERIQHRPPMENGRPPMGERPSPPGQ